MNYTCKHLFAFASAFNTSFVVSEELDSSLMARKDVYFLNGISLKFSDMSWLLIYSTLAYFSSWPGRRCLRLKDIVIVEGRTSSVWRGYRVK
jgi:hypothetical protein